MKKYMSIFRIKFLNGLQYRVAALAGLATQFAWGGLLVLLYKAFYETNPTRFPMTMQQTASYIWLQQAFLTLFASWYTDDSIFDCITDGSVAYELTRPVNLYSMWFARNVGMRLARAVLRCFPVLIFAMLLPAPYGLTLPKLDAQTVGFLVSGALTLHIVVAYTMLSYVVTFWTMSARGVRVMFQTWCSIFAGELIPIPFLPSAVRRIVELSPFAFMQDTPLRIYSGSIAGADIAYHMLGQVIWLGILVGLGLYLMRRALRRVVAQGG